MTLPASRRGRSARGPGDSPGALRVALHGAFTGPTDPEWDADGAFHTRARAMGWLGAGAGGGLWGTTDADVGGGEGAAVAYEASLVGAVREDEPLPVVPLLVCAVDATRRLGAFRLDGADVTLPVGALRVAAGGPLLRPGAVAGLLSTGRWYGGDAADAVPVTFRLAVGGQEDRTPPGPLSWLRALDQKVVRFPAAPGSGGAGALAAWSAEVIGWTAALVAEAARQAGVTGPVEFGVRRA